MARINVRKARKARKAQDEIVIVFEPWVRSINDYVTHELREFSEYDPGMPVRIRKRDVKDKRYG
jgi:hypothetical protein